MKTNGWLIFGMMLATGAVAQDNTGAVPSTPAPAAPPPAAVAPAAAPAETAAPAEKAKPARHRHKVAAPAKVNLNEPTVTLVPGPAQSTVNLNVRGQAGLKGEVVAHLKKGDTVTVLSQINLEKHKAGEPAQWAQIALPSNTHVWVKASFIDQTNKTVLPRRLNLRAGPSEYHNVLGVIDRGTPVNEIRIKNGWMEIEAPTNAFAFVAAMYLTQTAPAPQPAPEAASEQQPAPVQQTAVESPPVNRVVSHEGVVGPVASIVAPTAYKLYDPNTYQTIDYLYTTSPDLDLSRYVNMRIIVTGVEGIDQRWPNSPIIAIQSIKVVSTNAVKHIDLRSPRQRSNAY